MKNKKEISNSVGMRARSAGELMSPVESVSASVLFFLASNTFNAAMEKSIRPWGINLSEGMCLLALLLRKKSLRPSDISHLLPIQQNAVSMLLTRLEKRKLVRRRRSAHDKREVGVTLTQDGKKLLDEISSQVVKLVSDIFTTSISRDEMTMFTDIVRKIRNASAAAQGTKMDVVELIEKEFLTPYRQVVERVSKNHGSQPQ